MATYKKDFALIYDKLYDEDFYKNYAFFIKKIINKEKIKKPLVLDVACGTGRLIYNLEKQNIRTEGLDSSEDMISIAKKRNKKVKFYHQDFINFNIEKKYDIISCTFDSINYITKKENIYKFLKNIKTHLKKEGIFIFDFNTIYKKAKSKLVKNGVIYKSNFKEKIWRIVIEGDNIQKEKHRERLYSFAEIKEAARKTDFQIIEVYQDFKKRAKKISYRQRLIVVAKAEGKTR